MYEAPPPPPLLGTCPGPDPVTGGKNVLMIYLLLRATHAQLYHTTNLPVKPAHQSLTLKHQNDDPAGPPEVVPKMFRFPPDVWTTETRKISPAISFRVEES
jgi:hypothetical protein